MKLVCNFTECKIFHKNMYGMIAEPPVQIIFGLHDYQWLNTNRMIQLPISALQITLKASALKQQSLILPINLKFGQGAVGTALLCPMLWQPECLNWCRRSFFERAHSHSWQIGGQPELLAGGLISPLCSLSEGLLELPLSMAAGFKESLSQEKKVEGSNLLRARKQCHFLTY